MTLYLLIGLSWVVVGLAGVLLWLVREREPDARWRVLLVAAATPFLLLPLASVCRLAIERAAALMPALDSPWPLAAVTALGAGVAAVRAVVIGRRQRMLLAACRAPDPAVASGLTRCVAELSRTAGLGRAPRVLVCPRGASACVLGVRRPTIVVSRELLAVLSAEELRAVLAHEVAHVRRRDHLLNWLGVVLRSALFYLPPWSVAWSTLADAREHHADRLAARYTGDPLALAAALVKVWRHAPAPAAAVGAVGMLARPGRLEARVRRLLAPERPPRPFWRAPLTGIVLVGGLVLAQTTVEGGSHLLAHAHPAAGDRETCCAPAGSPSPHCLPPPHVFLGISTTSRSSPPSPGAFRGRVAADLERAHRGAEPVTRGGAPGPAARCGALPRRGRAWTS
jgi:Zn-dependent protease with chaperone function